MIANVEGPAIAEVRIIFHDSGAGLCWEDGLYSGRNGPEHCRNVPMGERMRRFFLAIKDGWRERRPRHPGSNAAS